MKDNISSKRLLRTMRITLLVWVILLIALFLFLVMNYDASCPTALGPPQPCSFFRSSVALLLLSVFTVSLQHTSAPWTIILFLVISSLAICVFPIVIVLLYRLKRRALSQERPSS